MKKKKGVMRGTEITGMHTLKSGYDNNALGVNVDVGNGEEYRMLASEALKMVNEFVFTLDKKRKYTYLTVNWDKTLELRQEEGK